MSQVVTKIQFRRGPNSERTIVPGPGEPIFTTDTKKLYVGDGETPGGLNIWQLSDNPDGNIDIKVPKGTMKFKNGILTGFSEAVDERTTKIGITDALSNQYGSNEYQYIHEDYALFSLQKTGGVSNQPVLVKATKYINGVITGVSNGPGSLLHTAINPGRNIDGSYILTNDSFYATGKKDASSYKWLVYPSEIKDTDKKGTIWMYVDSISVESKTHNWKSWVYIDNRSCFSDPQQVHNDGMFMYFNKFSGWAFTSLSLYPYMWLADDPASDLLGASSGTWTYVAFSNDIPHYYNFDNQTWYYIDPGGTRKSASSAPSTPGGGNGLQADNLNKPADIPTGAPDTLSS